MTASCTAIRDRLVSPVAHPHGFRSPIAPGFVSATVGADSLETVADSLYQAGAFAAARQAYERLVRRDGTAARHWYRLAVCQQRERRSTEARRSLDRAIAGARTTPGGRMLLSYAAYGAAAAHARLSDSARATPEAEAQRTLAFAWLDTAVATGFTSVTQLDGDADLGSLRGDPRYAALSERMRRAAQPCAYDSTSSAATRRRAGEGSASAG